MKYTLFSIFLTALLLTSCSKDTLDANDYAEEFVFKFQKTSSLENLDQKNTIAVNATIIKENGITSIESDVLQMKDIILEDGTKTKLIYHSGIKPETNKKSSGLTQTGYLFYPDGCFHYTLYIEFQGQYYIVDICDGTKCVGFESYCPGQGSAYA